MTDPHDGSPPADAEGLEYAWVVVDAGYGKHPGRSEYLRKF